MAELDHGKLQATIPQLEKTLTGQVGAHQRFLLAEQLARIDFLDDQIERMSAEIPVAGIEVDMTYFSMTGHLASWTGMAPTENQRAGKRRSGKTRKGDSWLHALLVDAGHIGGRTSLLPEAIAICIADLTKLGTGVNPAVFALPW